MPVAHSLWTSIFISVELQDSGHSKPRDLSALLNGHQFRGLNLYASMLISSNASMGGDRTLLGMTHLLCRRIVSYGMHNCQEICCRLLMVAPECDLSFSLGHKG